MRKEQRRPAYNRKNQKSRKPKALAEIPQDARHRFKRQRKSQHNRTAGSSLVTYCVVKEVAVDGDAVTNRLAGTLRECLLDFRPARVILHGLRIGLGFREDKPLFCNYRD